LIESKQGSNFCFDAFSSREPVPTLGSRLSKGFAGPLAHSAAEALAKAARGHALLKNALTTRSLRKPE
jgi:hypothetical protein